MVLNNGENISMDMLPPPLNQPVENQIRVDLQDKDSFSVHDIFPLWLTEKKAIEQAIQACEGNIPKAAGYLDVSPSTLYRKLQNWNTKETQ